MAVDRKKLPQRRFTTYRDNKNNERVHKIKVKKWAIVTVHNIAQKGNVSY